MTKTTSQLQNLIEDWCNSVGIKLENITDKANEKHAIYDFFLQGGDERSKFNFEKIKGRDDRIIITSGVNISPSHLEALAKLNPKEQAQFMQDINEFVVLSGCQISWPIKEGKPTGLVISDWVDVDEFERPDLYRKLDKVGIIKGLMVGRFQVKLNPSASISDVSSTDTKSMYG